MKRTRLTLTCVIATLSLTASTAMLAYAAPLHRAHVSRATVVSLRHTSLGRLLVSASGRTLYVFSRDHGARNSCISIRGCSETWPPLKSSGRPLAGAGVRASLLSTIKLPGGVRQVTYAGHPLYLYSGDSGPGETSYVGVRAFGGNWYGVSSSGGSIR